jgi:hypothetical protein
LILHRWPMLFRNPSSSVQRGSDRQAANLAPVNGPLGSISVSGKDCLQFITEAPLARLGRSSHNSPRFSQEFVFLNLN